MENGIIYHIYNRGINSANIFIHDTDYQDFLGRYKEKMAAVADTLAFCLLPNHFHFLIRIKDSFPQFPLKHPKGAKDEGRLFMPDPVKQFSHVCNGYVQKFNKTYGRHGGLLETPFGRKIITDDHYLSWCIWYIHRNPQHHQLTDNFEKWPYSSYHMIVNGDKNIIAPDIVIDFFGDVHSFIRYHDMQQADYEDTLGFK